MTRSGSEFDAVTDLVAEGWNDCAISRLTAVPRSTVRDWRRGRGRDTTRPPRSSRQFACAHDFAALPEAAYSYLLGLYLGDGYISLHQRGVWRLRITLDVRYPEIIEQCCIATEALMPGQRAYRLSRKGCVEVSMYSKHWTCLFPQHGPGRKHERAIFLREWQQELVTQEPWRILRGLIHSDGCRIVASDRGVASVRYHFSNRSEDIKRLFCASLDRIGVSWTRPCDRQIAVYRKEGVARLDEFIGPKR